MLHLLFHLRVLLFRNLASLHLLLQHFELTTCVVDVDATCHEPSPFRVRADGGDEVRPVSIEDLRTSQKEAFSDFLHSIRFTGHGGLIHEQAARCDNNTVRANLVTRRDDDDISHDKIVQRDALWDGISYHVDRDIFMQGIQLAELLVLIPVCHRSCRNDDNHRGKNAHAIIPACRPTFCGDFRNESKNSAAKQNKQSRVV